MSPRHSNKLSSLLLGLSLGLSLGCGYDQGYVAASLGIRTVSIRVVENESFKQNIDASLTRQLARDLTQMTGLVAGTPRTADAVLDVRIQEIQGRALTEGTQGSIREGALVVVCEVEVRDRASGAILHRARHSDQAEFRIPVGEGRNSAYDEMLRDLSRKILIAIGRKTKKGAPRGL